MPPEIVIREMSSGFNDVAGALGLVPWVFGSSSRENIARPLLLIQLNLRKDYRLLPGVTE